MTGGSHYQPFDTGDMTGNPEVCRVPPKSACRKLEASQAWQHCGRITSKQEVIGDWRDLEDKWFPTCVELSMFSIKADARPTSALVTEWSQKVGSVGESGEIKAPRHHETRAFLIRL